MSAKYGHLLIHRTSIFHRGCPVSLHPAMHAICHRFRLLSTHTPVFFDSATGTMEILPTVVQSECFTRTYECLSSGKLRKTLGVAYGEDSRSLAQHCRGEGTSRSSSHLFSLHLLATPLPVPGSFGPKPCAPLVSSGTLFGPGVTEGLQEGRYLSLCLARIGKNFCLSRFAK